MGELARRHDKPQSGGGRPPPSLHENLRYLVDRRVIDYVLARAIEQLRDLRNLAAHAPADDAISLSQAERFSLSANAVLSALQELMAR